MDRATQVDIHLATLDEPVRTHLRGAVVAQRQGRLDTSRRVCAAAALSQRALRWPVLLIALMAAELRLGGAVVFHSPRLRFFPGGPRGPEQWGPFLCKVYPEEFTVALGLEEARTSDGHPFLELSVRPPEAWRHSKATVDAVSTLVVELRDHFGVAVRAKLLPS